MKLLQKSSKQRFFKHIVFEIYVVRTLSNSSVVLL